MDEQKPKNRRGPQGKGKFGDYLPAAIAKKRIEEMSMPEPNSGCWLWLGAGALHSYGCVWNGFRPEGAHRVSYRAFVADIPDGMQLDHLCRVRACVNPGHLEIVTAQENLHRADTVTGINARKTCCSRGHLLSGDNVRLSKQGRRGCRACQALHAFEKRRAKGIPSRGKRGPYAGRPSLRPVPDTAAFD